MLVGTTALADDPGAGERDNPPDGHWAIAIHGGAGRAPDPADPDARAVRRAGLKRALGVGRKVLASGGTSLDAVEKVVRTLEDDPAFNAGKGAVFNGEGGHELDASIMDGQTHACGAVAGARTAKNPISLARLVMTETRHVLLSGDGADAFAKTMGVDQVGQDYYWTEARHRAWKKAQWKEQQKRRENKQETSGTSGNYEDAPGAEGYFGTVGCVALDTAGNIAAGTSTGGLTNKMFGRVGDSPVVGAGTYADNATCGVSGTGIGEEFIRNAIAYDVSARMRYQRQPLAEAVTAVIDSTLRPKTGGVIAVGADGTVVMKFNTADMARGAADSNGRFEVFWGDEKKN